MKRGGAPLFADRVVDQRAHRVRGEALAAAEALQLDHEEHAFDPRAEAFGQAQSRALFERSEIHYTPRHAS